MRKLQISDSVTAFPRTSKVSPPNRSLTFTEAIDLEFHTLQWSHGDVLLLAYVPTLGIEVHAKTAEELDERLVQEIRAALFRTKALSSLEKLVFLQHRRSLAHRRVSVLAERRTPKQQEEHESRPTATKSTLKEVGRKLVRGSLPPAFEVDDLVDCLADALSSSQRPSVLLVGPSGSGKTAIVHELVRRHRNLDLPLSAATFWATSGSRLVAGQSGFGMWQERCQALCREARDASAILHLGNLVELLHVGKSEHNAQGIASFLKPFIQRGELQIIVECTPEAIARIEGDDPQLPKLFHQISIEPPTRKGLLEILRCVAEERSRRGEATVSQGALEMLERLHRRYARYSASPGRPLRFLESLLRDRSSSENRAVSGKDIATSFTRETGLPDFMVDDDLPLDLEATRSFFSKRVLGQRHAVDLTVDVLATTKTALGRPGKPLASMMLVGPTGVGKTELAKVLAEFLFGSSSRLARFDMSEYTDVGAVGRLTAGLSHSQGSGEGLLTAKVREEPFSVVLLDEIEKAHPLFFDLLLQVLGEARLTDAMGRMADFSSAVVIMTSNLGAEAFSQHPLGFQEGDQARAARDTVLNAVREFYRPELMNRIDRIVPFAPLNQETLCRIATLQLDGLQCREGVAYRSLDLGVDETVASWLAQKGYDPRYGARPLRRSIERELLAPLSTAVNRYGSDMSLTAQVLVDDHRLNVDLQAEPSKGTSRSGSLSVPNARLKAVSDLSDQRREVQRIMKSPAAIDMRNGIFRLARAIERMERRKLRGRPLPQRYDEHQRRIAQLRRVDQQLRSLWSTICEQEEQALLALYQGTLDEDTTLELVVDRGGDIGFIDRCGSRENEL